ncbi:MAG TPA: hypothetical protein VF226_07430 [Hyphomicrobiaceae bacterium]
MPDSVIWAIFSTLNDHQEINDQSIVQSFVASGGMTRAQLVLRTAVGFSLKEGERIHWKSVGKNLDAILRSEDRPAPVLWEDAVNIHVLPEKYRMVELLARPEILRAFLHQQAFMPL